MPVGTALRNGSAIQQSAVWVVAECDFAITAAGRRVAPARSVDTISEDLGLQRRDGWDGFAARDALEEVVSSGGGQVVRPVTMTVALRAPWGTARNSALSLLNLATP